MSRWIFVTCVVLLFVEFSDQITVTVTQFNHWNNAPLCTNDQGALAVCNEYFPNVDAQKTGCQDESLGLLDRTGQYDLKTIQVVSCGFAEGDNIVITYSGRLSQKLVWTSDEDGVFYPNRYVVDKIKVTVVEFDTWNDTPLCANDQAALIACHANFTGINDLTTGCHQESVGLVGQNGIYELNQRTVVSCGFFEGDNVVLTYSGTSRLLIWICDDDGVFFANRYA